MVSPGKSCPREESLAGQGWTNTIPPVLGQQLWRGQGPGQSGLNLKTVVGLKGLGSTAGRHIEGELNSTECCRPQFEYHFWELWHMKVDSQESNVQKHPHLDIHSVPIT